jgi:hypothetical protein
MDDQASVSVGNNDCLGRPALCRHVGAGQRPLSNLVEIKSESCRTIGRTNVIFLHVMYHWSPNDEVVYLVFLPCVRGPLGQIPAEGLRILRLFGCFPQGLLEDAGIKLQSTVASLLTLPNS